jgi:hypothetical protein
MYIPLVGNIVLCVVDLICFCCGIQHIPETFFTRYYYHLMMLSRYPKFHTANYHFIAVHNVANKLPWRFGDAQSSPRELRKCAGRFEKMRW